MSALDEYMTIVGTLLVSFEVVLRLFWVVHLRNSYQICALSKNIISIALTIFHACFYVEKNLKILAMA